MSANFDAVQYKINTRSNWNTVASDYHHNWAAKKVGPFRSTHEIVMISKIEPSDRILDLGCGTGAVSREVSKLLDNRGLLVGIDLSRTALDIARKSVQFANSLFIEMDAENIGLHCIFDKILCQYVLMFCPDAKRVLESAKASLKEDGKIALAVHGLSDGVPYFSVIMNAILKHIPDIRPEGTPTVHRFGDPRDLRSLLKECGFNSISIQKHDYVYHPGTFEEYWDDYMHSTANSIRQKIEQHGMPIVSEIKKDAKTNAEKYIKDDKITFPWAILIASAVNNE